MGTNKVKGSTAVAPSWVIRGIPVELTQRGYFEARITNRTVRRASLSGIRREIDRLKPFTPFKALTLSYDGIVREVEVTAHHAQPNRHGEWTVSSGGTRREIYPLTARKQLQQFAARCAREGKAEQKRQAARDAARARIKAITEVPALLEASPPPAAEARK